MTPLSSSWLTQWSEELDDEVAVKFFAPGPSIIKILALAPQGLRLQEGGWLVDLHLWLWITFSTSVLVFCAFILGEEQVLPSSCGGTLGKAQLLFS